MASRSNPIRSRCLVFFILAALSVGACGPALPAIAALPVATGVPQVASSPTPVVPAPARLPDTPLPTLTALALATRTPLAPTVVPSVTPAATSTAGLAPATVVVVGPTPDAQAPSRQVRLPILMYHYVEPWPAGATDMRKGLTVRPEDFVAQISYLHQQGYVTVSLYDLVKALALGQPLPEKAVVLTFDDGYRSLVDYALPAMQPYGYTGTVFVITQLMDEGFPQYLTWPQAESLYALGWKIEPHTKTHDTLAGRERDFQLYQMLGSLETVAAHIGTTPRFINYPSGKYDALSVQLAKEMHLWGAVTVAPGRVHSYESLYTLKRVRVSGLMTFGEFVRALERDLGS